MPPPDQSPEFPEDDPLEVSFPAAEAAQFTPDSSGEGVDDLALRFEQLEASLAAQLHKSHAALLQNSQHRIWSPLTKIWQHQLEFVQHLDDKLADLGSVARRQRLILSYYFPLTWLGLLLLAALLIFR
ncbi:MAG: hypothetical protein HYY96_06000 [Candidatus Tectomicrobia bacterium]|nr:hypothetical protein [Candidatus Tectomicrobia bacterium]